MEGKRKGVDGAYMFRMRPLVSMAVLGGMTCASKISIDDRGTKAVQYTLVACRHLLSHGDERRSVALLTEDAKLN